MNIRDISEFSHLLQQQQRIEARLDSRLYQANAYQAGTLQQYNRSTQIIQFPDGGTRNSRLLSNSSQVVGAAVPLVTLTPGNAYLQSR